jgi:predicted DNA-binding transcriptional regulator AlpA
MVMQTDHKINWLRMNSPLAGEIDARTAIETSVPRLWRPRDLALRLGISRAMIYKLVKTGEFQALHLAKSIRITEGSVLDYLKRCQQRTHGAKTRA